MYERYLNPFVDFGFKKLFGSEENKDLLISFLNALIGGDDPITDLNYKNVERIGDVIGTRTNYFDVYCDTASDDQFIVEMQNTWQPFFKDRTVYYASKPIHDQGKKGLQQADDELTLYYVELPKLDHAKLDLSTPMGRWFHALNSLYFYDAKPNDLDDPIFDKLFRQAELAMMTPDEDLAYERSMKVYLDTYNQIEGGRILGHQQGLLEGEKQGFAKGEKQGKELGLAEGRLEIVKKMIELGMDPQTIQAATGVALETIENIRQHP